MRNESGLTLFELMVVVGIMAILASVAVPGFLGWLPKYRMRSAADDVLSTLQNAKLRAVRENSVVRVTFDFANDRYLSFLDNVAGANTDNGTQEADEATINNGQMPAGIDLSDDKLGPMVRFVRSGVPTAAS